MNNLILIVDGPYLAHRSFGAPYKLTTTTNLDATMIHSFIRTLNSLRKQFLPRQIIIAWESHGTKSWRRELLSEYKPSSGSVTQEYIDELRDLQILLYLLGVKQYNASNNEADDVIATLVKQMKEDMTFIYTIDKDIMQLINKVVHVWDGKQFYSENVVKKKFKVEPYQIPDYLAIVGDSSDNIKGIKGYGPVKAVELLNKYMLIEGIPNTEKIWNEEVQLAFNRKLITLNDECELEPVPNKDFKTNETIVSIMDKYELKKMKEKIEEYRLLGGN